MVVIFNKKNKAKNLDRIPLVVLANTMSEHQWKTLRRKMAIDTEGRLCVKQKKYKKGMKVETSEIVPHSKRNSQENVEVSILRRIACADDMDNI